MSKDKIYMCSNCDTLFDTSEEALECCQCENCAALKKQLAASTKAWVDLKFQYQALEEQLEAVRPYLKHSYTCNRVKITSSEARCVCGLTAIVGDNDEQTK